MIDIFDLYKPLRNELKKIDLRSILAALWHFQQFADISGEIVAKDSYGRPLGKLYIWELHLVCRETIIHADPSGRGEKLSTQRLFALVNHVRRINEGVSDRIVNSGESAFRALHPLIHQQARWQYERNWDRFYRTHCVFGADEMRVVVEETTGVAIHSLLTLALATSRTFVCDSRIDYTGVGVSHTERDAFFQLVGTDLDALRRTLIDSQPYVEGPGIDESWEFKWNPLEATPFIRLDPKRPNEYVCPFPGLAQRRVTDGLFYDVVRSDRDFSNAYGRAFEKYTGSVLEELFAKPKFVVHGERPYLVKGNIKHGPDWIVSDTTGNIFVECKTRRIAVGAKVHADGPELEASLSNLADIIVQHYKNIEDAIDGRSRWEPNGLPIYPFVLTLDDWYLFSKHVVDRLEDLVREKLDSKKIDPCVTKSMPYTVASIAEFERGGQAMAQLGIARFCASRTAEKYRHFGLSTFAGAAFPEDRVKTRELFPGAGEEMLPNLSDLMVLPGGNTRN